jgi:hypothetical protein
LVFFAVKKSIEIDQTYACQQRRMGSPNVGGKYKGQSEDKNRNAEKKGLDGGGGGKCLPEFRNMRDFSVFESNIQN